MKVRITIILAALLLLAATIASTASARPIRDYHPQFGYCGPNVVDMYRLDNDFVLWQCIYLYNWMGNDYYQWWEIPH